MKSEKFIFMQSLSSDVKTPETPPDWQRLPISPHEDETLMLAKAYNDKYYHWSDLKYHDTGPDSRETLWALMKLFRTGTARTVDIGSLKLCYNLTDDAHRILHELDMRLSCGIVPESALDGKRRLMFTVSSMMEESIASSQIEGASTTTKVAKKMLRENATPKDRSQRMILNNYRAMQFIRDHSEDELTPGLIREIHGIISHDTLDDPSYEGHFREDNSIAVRDVFRDKTYHEPPDHTLIDGLIRGLCDFANDESVFVHPVVKGIVLHFSLAYIHPFMDGNGRVSRSLFYWYLLKKGYPAIEFLSVSKVIKSHRGRYDQAYLLSETDDNDITYFINYNLAMLAEATDVFLRYVERKMSENARILDDARSSGLTVRQRDILNDLMHSSEPMDVYVLSSKNMVSQASVRRDLLKLEEAGLVEQRRDGRKVTYSFRDL